MTWEAAMNDDFTDDSKPKGEVHAIYTLDDGVEETLVSDLLEESGVNFFVQTYDDHFSSEPLTLQKGYGNIMVDDQDLELALEVIKAFVKDKKESGGKSIMVEFDEDEGNFVPLDIDDEPPEDDQDDDDTDLEDGNSDFDDDIIEEEDTEEDIEEEKPEDDLDEKEIESEGYYDSDDRF
jgi:hypothetical protein